MPIVSKKHKSETACFNYVEAGDDRVIHFAHANGFPPGVYKPLFEKLENKFRVISMNFCGQSRCFSSCEFEKPALKNWGVMADELIAFLDEMKTGPVLAAGHSMGGVVTAMASISRPDLFSRIILLDPVFLEPAIVRLAWLANTLGQTHRHPLASRARKRRNRWKSRADAFDFFKDKNLFHGWEEHALRAYVNHGLSDTADGVELACHPEFEALVFETYPTDIWRIIKNISVRCIVARGEHSDVITDRSWAMLAKARPDIPRIEMSGLGHLFPMQDSEKTARFIFDSCDAGN